MREWKKAKHPRTNPEGTDYVPVISITVELLDTCSLSRSSHTAWLPVTVLTVFSTCGTMRSWVGRITGTEYSQVIQYHWHISSTPPKRNAHDRIPVSAHLGHVPSPVQQLHTLWQVDSAVMSPPSSSSSRKFCRQSLQCSIHFPSRQVRGWPNHVPPPLHAKPQLQCIVVWCFLRFLWSKWTKTI